jgi:hypothetical protein
MVTWYPGDDQWWRPWPARYDPVIIVIVILVFVVGITYTTAQMTAMASLIAVITAAVMPQPRRAVAGP